MKKLVSKLMDIFHQYFITTLINEAVFASDNINWSAYHGDSIWPEYDCGRVWF